MTFHSAAWLIPVVKTRTCLHPARGWKGVDSNLLIGPCRWKPGAVGWKVEYCLHPARGCYLKWDQPTVYMSIYSLASFSSICARCFVRSLLSWNNKTGSTWPHNVHRDVIALQRPARAEGRCSTCWLDCWVLCMISFHRSWLHPAQGWQRRHGPHGTCSVQTSPTDVIAGTVGNARKCRKTSTLWILNVRKSQLCFHIFHLTPWDSQASFCATAIWNEFNLHSQTAGCSERRIYHKCTHGAYFVCWNFHYVKRVKNNVQESQIATQHFAKHKARHKTVLGEWSPWWKAETCPDSTWGW